MKSTGKTHVIGGLMAGVITANYLDIGTGYAIVAAVGSLFPDIDTPASKIGRNIPIFSFLLNLIFGHRGLWHSILASVFFYVLLNNYFPYYIAVLFCIGYLSHLILDMFTPEGVPLLFPVLKRFSIPIVRTGGIVEYLFLFFMVTACIFLFAEGGF